MIKNKNLIFNFLLNINNILIIFIFTINIRYNNMLGY